MEYQKEPDFKLAKKVLPGPLLESISFIFKKGLKDVVLVGGTALSGFYLSHRKSDDIDLFARDEKNKKSAVLACKSLRDSGAVFSDEFQTAQYFRSTCLYKGHRFTIDIAVDKNIFDVAQYFCIENNIHVLSLESIFMTKAASLLSRCSEKDLYDLLFISEYLKGDTVSKLIDYGKMIDSSLSAEALILSIGGAILNEVACDFSPDNIRPEIIYKEIEAFRKELLKQLDLYLRQKPAIPLKEIVSRIKKFDR